MIPNVKIIIETKKNNGHENQVEKRKVKEKYLLHEPEGERRREKAQEIITKELESGEEPCEMDRGCEIKTWGGRITRER